MQDLAIIKLGGSVVTFKECPLEANMQAIEGISRALARLDMPLIAVHGGGSFGHYWSMKYDMHTLPAPYDPRGIAVVHESMMALNQIIVNVMLKAGLNPYAIAPPVYTTGNRGIPAKIKDVYAMTKSKVLPVTYGDVVYMSGRKYSILSGDAIMSILAKALKPSRVVFVTNVDGIYKDMNTKELLREIEPKKSAVKFGKAASIDVTGGMQRKIREAFKIASMGMDVMLVNGLVPERIEQAAKGRLDIGTVIRGHR